MRRNGYSFQLTYAKIGLGVMVRFSRQGGIDVMDYEAETAPEAICGSR